MLLCAALALWRQGAGLAPGLLAGGATALTSALTLPPRLAARQPVASGRGLGSRSHQVAATIVRLRRPWLPVAACLPYFVGLVVVSELGAETPVVPAAGLFVAGAVIGALHIGPLAFGVQCLQVRRALDREA